MKMGLIVCLCCCCLSLGAHGSGSLFGKVLILFDFENIVPFLFWTLGDQQPLFNIDALIQDECPQLMGLQETWVSRPSTLFTISQTLVGLPLLDTFPDAR